MRRGCWLQGRGALQGRSGSQQHVVAHLRSGKELRLARGGIREHEAFSGHGIRGPTGTGCVGVSMDGERQVQGAGKGEGVRGCRLPSPPVFFENVLCVSAFCLDEGGCERITVLYAHIHEF